MCYFDLVKSVIFAQRNDRKVACGDKGRIFAEVGQIGNAVAATTKLDNAVGKGAKAAVDAFCRVSESNKALGIAKKGVDLARNNVNPLLIGAAAYRVLNAEDKEKAFKKEMFGMGSMFCAENLIKQAYSSATFQNWFNSITDSKVKALVGICQGITFVIGSVLGSTIGYKIGDCLVETRGKKLNKAQTVKLHNKMIQKSKDKQKNLKINTNKTVANPVQNQFTSDTPECFQLKSGKMIA